MSVLKKSLLVVAALALLLAGAAAVFVLTFDANRYRSVILAQLSRTVKRPVEAAELELKLVPLRLRLNQVRIPEDPSFKGEDFIRADAVQFDFSLVSLLRGETQVRALELDRPTVTLRQNAAGEWNVATLAAAPGPRAKKAERAPAAAPAAPVRSWRLREGTIIVERAGQPPLRLTGVELAVEDLSVTKAFPFRVAMSFAADSRVSAQGRLGPLDLAAPARTPLTAKLTMENFRPAALASLVAVPPALARLGALGGALELRSTPEEVSLAGQVTLLGSKSDDNLMVNLDATLPADFSRVELRDTALSYRAARVSGQGSVTLAPALRFDLAAATDNADLGVLQRIPPRLGYALPALPPATGKLTAKLKLDGTPEAWRVAGTAAMRELAVTLEGFAQPLRVPALDLTLEPDRIVAAPFSVSPEPGLSLTLSGTVARYRTQPTLAARVGGGEVPLGPLLGLAARFGVKVLGEGQQLSGFVKPDLELNGPLAEPAKLGYQGTLAFRDLTLTTPQVPEPVRIPALELALTAARLTTQPFTAQVGQKLTARLTVRLDNYQTRPALDAHVETDGADLEALLGLVRTLGSDPLPGGRASGRVTAAVDARGRLGELAPPLNLSGRARLNSASVELAALTQPLAIEQVDVEFAADRLQVTNLRLAAAGSNVQGSLRVDDFNAPRVNFDLRGDRLDIAGLQALFGAQPAAPSAAPRKRRRRLSELFLPVVHAQEKPAGDWFAKLSGRGRLEFDQVKHGTLLLAPLAAPVAIANQVVTCDPVQFGLYEGGGRGRLVIDLRGAEPQVEFNGLLRNVDANQLLSANSESKDRLHGRLGGTVTLRFQGSERPQIVRSAKGQGELTLVNGRLTQLNLSRELAAAGKLVGHSFDQRETPIEDMATQFEIADGWVRTNDLTLRTPDLTMKAVGGFSLEDELAFESIATFTPEASQRMASRSPLGGFLTDNQGRVVLPFLIRGTFAAPRVLPDTERLLKMKLGGRGDTPGGVVGDILDRLRKRKPPQ